MLSFPHFNNLGRELQKSIETLLEEKYSWDLNTELVWYFKMVKKRLDVKWSGFVMPFVEVMSYSEDLNTQHPSNRIN